MKCHSEDPDIRHFIEAHFQYSEKLYELHNNFDFLQESSSARHIEERLNKLKFATNLYNRKKHDKHITNLKRSFK